jgi:hypothetical protein
VQFSASALMHAKAPAVLTLFQLFIVILSPLRILRLSLLVGYLLLEVSYILADLELQISNESFIRNPRWCCHITGWRPLTGSFSEAVGLSPWV